MMKSIPVWVIAFLMWVLDDTPQQSPAGKRWKRGDKQYEYSTSYWNLAGPVKSMHESVYEVQNGTAVLLYRSDFEFNTDGNIVSHKKFNSAGSSGIVETFRYLRSGDIGFKETSTINFGRDTGKNWEYYSYNYMTHTRSVRVMSTTGKLLLQKATVFDAHDRQISSKTEGAFGNSSAEYEYDAAGRMVAVKEQNGTGQSVTHLLFDAQGNEIGNRSGADTFYVATVFDRFGNALGKDDSLVYDRHQNWVKKFQRSNKRTFLIGTRNIVYYED